MVPPTEKRSVAVFPCPHTPAVAAAAEAGTLTRDPHLSRHLQVCEHCLARVFGVVREQQPSPPLVDRRGTGPPDEAP